VAVWVRRMLVPGVCAATVVRVDFQERSKEVMNTEKAQEEWNPPASIEEAEVIRLRLVEQLNDINAQLTARRVGGPACDGVYAEDRSTFFDWRRRAVCAKKFTEARLRQLNLWIKQQRRAHVIDKSRSLCADPTSPLSLLIAAGSLLSRLASEGVELDDDEQAVLDAIRNYMQNVAVDEPRGAKRQ
jgi:hypothetical protein